jgi:hypothetical protein
VGRLTPEEAQRWEDIQRIYRRNVRLRGVGEDDKVGLVVTELSGLSDSLDSIRQALGSGLDQLLTQEQPEPVTEPSPLAASFSPETIVAMKGLVDEFKAALQKRLEPETANLPPQEIHVVSRIPATILNVLRHQFKLMQGWLHPLLEQSRGQSQEITKLRELIADNLTGYQTLISQLEEAAAEDDALLEKLAKHKIKVTQAHRPHPERDAK